MEPPKLVATVASVHVALARVGDASAVVGEDHPPPLADAVPVELGVEAADDAAPVLHLRPFTAARMSDDIATGVAGFDRSPPWSRSCIA